MAPEESAPQDCASRLLAAWAQGGPTTGGGRPVPLVVAVPPGTTQQAAARAVQDYARRGHLPADVIVRVRTGGVLTVPQALAGPCAHPPGTARQCSCTCPLDGLPLYYSQAAGQHACQDAHCANGHGMQRGGHPV